MRENDQSSGWKLMEWMEMYYYGEDPAIAFYFLQVSIAVCVNSKFVQDVIFLQMLLLGGPEER